MENSVGIDDLVKELAAFKDKVNNHLTEESLPPDLSDRLSSVRHMVASLLEDVKRRYRSTDQHLGITHLSGGDQWQDRRCENVNEPLGTSAYIAVDNANCLYKPQIDSAVRLVPPFGTKVFVIRDQGSWVLIEFCGKQAWSPRSHLSASLTPSKLAPNVGVVPLPNYAFRPSVIPESRAIPEIEYGPRGGRFIRTISGFRRYL